MAPEYDHSDQIRQDKIDAYLFSRMSEPERRAFEAELAGDKDLQAALDAQRLLIAGVRSVGRAELKAELRRQLGDGATGQLKGDFAWIKIAAAVLVVAVSVGGYFLIQRPAVEEQTMAINAPAEANDAVETREKQESAEVVSEVASPPPSSVSEEQLSPTAGRSTIASKQARPKAGGTARSDVSDNFAATAQATEAGAATAAPKTDSNSILDDLAARSAAIQAEAEPPVSPGEALLSDGDLAPAEVSSSEHGEESHQFVLSDHQVRIELKAPRAVLSEDEAPAGLLPPKRSRSSANQKSAEKGFRRSPEELKRHATGAIGEFEVSVLREADGNIAMTWFVEARELAGDLEKMTLELIEDHFLEVRLEGGEVYRIDLSKANSRAVLVPAP